MKLLLIMMFSVFCIHNMNADERHFVWTYEYMIMERGAKELETYTTFKTIDTDDFEGSTSTELNFELEMGMTDRFDFAIYQNFNQSPEGSFKYSGFKLRSRYKIGEQDKYWLDPLIYVEYIGEPSFTEHKIETKLILAKTLNNFFFSLNPYFEVESEDEEWEFVPKYSVGAGYRLGSIFTAGIEAKGDKNANYVGPTISHGNHSMYSALGALFAYGDVKENKPEYQIRLIIGIGL